MDSMFPRVDDPPAPMLQDVRGSAKRAINYFWIRRGGLGMDGVRGRIYATVLGSPDESVESRDSRPVSYDVVSANMRNVFDVDPDDTPWHDSVAGFTRMYGLEVDASTWTESNGWMRVRVRRG